jgi:asparagine synthase (glutamine-hydrolysing)
MDEAQLFARLDDPDLRWPEPIENPFLAVISDAYRDISMDCRVLFSGEGSDNLMDFQMWPYVADLRRRGDWRRLLTEVANYLWVRPFPWRGIRVRALGLIGKDPDQPVYPWWLAPEFSRSMNLKARWKEQNQLPKSWRTHPIHPRGHGSLSLPQWTHMFEQGDAGATGYPVETCYPFLDLRMVNYLLAIPPFPWFFKKTLLREAMARRLPERVRSRPKTPLQGDPMLAQLQRAGSGPWKELSLAAELGRYVDRSAITAPPGKMNAEQARSVLRPYCLNMWLQSGRRIRYNLHAEGSNG